MTRRVAALGSLVALSVVYIATASAQEAPAAADSVALAAPAARSTGESRVSAPPFVPGGFDDKPYLRGIFGRIAVGGYVEAAATWEREDGATEELGFELVRWNLLAATRIRESVSIWSEVEFEDGGQEVRLELAQIDLRLHPAFNLRAGMLLSPLGRFNLAHDAPRNPFTARPLVATELLGVALSEPGGGAFGEWRRGERRLLTYEIYAVNGFGDGVLGDSPEGTRVAAGRTNFEDNNASPAVVGRVAWSPATSAELGVSGHHGAYNVYRIEGLDVDERRDLTIGVLDGELSVRGFVLRGEGAIVRIEIPSGLAPLFADRQAGFYLETTRVLRRGWFRSEPTSELSAAVRVDAVDFDRAIPGDSRRKLSVGLGFRPAGESVVKLDYVRGDSRDRFNNVAQSAGLALSIATYF